MRIVKSQDLVIQYLMNGDVSILADPFIIKLPSKSEIEFAQAAVYIE